MSSNSELNVLPLSNNIIDGGTGETNDQLYFIGTGDNYIQKSNSNSSTISGNFQVRKNPLGKKFSDILDGGDSENTTSQFLGSVIGGVFPTTKNDI